MSFISSATPSHDDPAVCFRRQFTVGEGLRRAILKVTALGVVVARINGCRVGDEVLAPGWTSYRHRLLLRSHDVTDLLTTGDNALGAVVGDGWAVGPLTWEMKRHNYTDRPALYARLELEYEDRTEVVATDAEFRVGEGPVRANGIYAGETYDARLENGWDLPGFDDGGWQSAQPFDWDLATLEESGAPPIRAIEELTPVSIATSPSGATIVDFGQILSGFVRFTVTGEAGDTVTLRHAEILTPDGELEVETLRKAESVDRYTLRGGGPETWQPEFTFHGFRYVQVDGPRPDSLTAVVVHTEMTRTGWFQTSNDLVSKLHENTVWGMRGNFVGVPTDCPQRDERLGWTGDLNAFAPTAAFLYDVRGMLGSWLTDLALEQQATGTVPWVVPDVLPHPSSPTALWSDVAVSLPWLLYQEYGDVEILRRAYPSMSAFIRQVEGGLNGDLWNTGFQYGDWLDPDAPADNPAGGKTDRYLVAQAYLCKTTREMARAADLLGEEKDAIRFGALAGRVRAAFRDEYVTRNGRVTNESATAYALAICFDILDDLQKQKAGRRLAELVEASGFTISTGFAGTPLIADALSATGHLDTAYLLLTQTRCPSFLYPVTMGATTIWERWDSVLPDGRVNATGMTSLNHYALGAVAHWLHRVVGGLQRTAPGWRAFTVAPQPGGDLTWARTAHDTVLGRAECHWRADGAEMVLDVTVPDGATATIVPPLHPEDLRVEVGAGVHTWRYPLPPGFGAAETLTMDSTMRDVARDARVWEAVRAVMKKHLPGIPLDAGGAQAGAMTLNMLAERIPGATEDLRRDLVAALTR